MLLIGRLIVEGSLETRTSKQNCSNEELPSNLRYPGTLKPTL